MNDEFKEVRKLIEGEDDVLFEEYLNRSRFGPKFWVGIIMVVALIVGAIVYKVVVLDKIVDPAVLKASLEIFDIDSQWVVAEEVHEKDFNGIVLAPQISFRFRNIGKEKLSYVYVLGVFRLLNRPRSLGEDNKMALRDGLEPGAESERIVLTCGFGYRATSKEAFARNSEKWQNASAEIFIRAGSSQMILFNTYYIIRKIEGMEKDVKIKIE
jgi:hypothetical protein